MLKNREKLLAELAHVAQDKRRQICELYRVLQHLTDPSPIIAEGECCGDWF